MVLNLVPSEVDTCQLRQVLKLFTVIDVQDVVMGQIDLSE